MPRCYSCRKVFEPSALRISYSKNYCENCGVGLFGKDYFGFSKKPDPTVQKKIAVYLKVIFAGVIGLSLLALIFFSMSAQSDVKSDMKSKAPNKGLSMVTDLTELRWKNRVILVDNVQNDGTVLALFETNALKIIDRDIVWFMFKGERTFTNYPGELSKDLLSNLREQYGLGYGQVILIGKDGGVKSRLDRVDLQGIFLQVDAMPMRQNEMRN
jgi:hypothetical protein